MPNVRGVSLCQRAFLRRPAELICILRPGVENKNTVGSFGNVPSCSFIQRAANLDLIPQVHTVGAGWTPPPKAVISGLAHARKLTQPVHACPSFRSLPGPAGRYAAAIVGEWQETFLEALQDFY